MAGLAKHGYKVGLIDADIFGFSLTKLLGVTKRPTRLDDMMLPPIAFGVKVISIGMFLDSNEPVSWRGPMLHKAVEQFLTDVYWGELDFLLIDMPPGTGDVSISVGQL
ncbi:MAG: sodium:proton antiporter, partial [Microbacteriaceae bacterium]|nr:sodium:proton antiporter [Microbacteriaceae bacterium]